MSSFNDRKDAFENKFAHDEGLRFRVEARTCKLFGLWVAEQLGLNGADATTYAGEVVAANLEEAGFDDVKRKVRPDIDAKGLDISDHMLDTMLDQFAQTAKEQIMAE
ncbi:DUF1476 domain-containing protein [Micavibrio aeruginosavorus]|uniref:DUF1476 domain-containing protein n=1 Tax=Micavibrio aeruginosavorus (strain ARL-13) TaxID=856793 RepID=G2KM74_MICAA|nr:DUF1476 domain-containing protein [Micavibrio aeruginosavorus]AEP10168.1 conserved hypothetical protein [Micavibrio aeruginosavorus ARL-13]